jgi:hypothetical protein
MSTKNMVLKKDLKEKRELVNIAIDRFLPRKDEYPKQIHKAIRHTLFAGGKLNDEDRDKVFKAITEIYWKSKEKNKKYIPKKYCK